MIGMEKWSTQGRSTKMVDSSKDISEFYDETNGAAVVCDFCRMDILKCECHKELLVEELATKLGCWFTVRDRDGWWYWKERALRAERRINI